MNEITSGVPQGSVLGPLLFLVFVSDLPDLVSPGTKIYQFADDLKLLRIIESETDIEILRKDIKALVKWSENNLMPLNLKKCKIVEYGKGNNNAKKFSSVSRNPSAPNSSNGTRSRS